MEFIFLRENITKLANISFLEVERAKFMCTADWPGLAQVINDRSYMCTCGSDMNSVPYRMCHSLFIVVCTV